jgi:cellulose synthase/poly-beta-1,6-N-acetylglucosamine synthase-like glycosyltransferase
MLKKLGWGATCLTEDLEFTCKLILHGYKIGWAHKAIVYDEKPLTLRQSWRQRKRWMQGFTDVASRYFFKLLKKGVTSFSFIPFDCALYSIQPIVTVLIGISAISGLVQHFMVTYNVISNFNTVVYSINISLFTILTIVASIFQYAYTPFVLILEEKLSFKIFLYYIIYPLYVLSWFPISIQGILNKNNKEWSHTVHTRSVKMKDLKKAN